MLSLLVIVALVITLLVFGIKGIITLVNKDPAETTTDSGNNPPPALPWNNAYVSVEHANSNIPVGDLILVNFKNEYPLTNEIGSNKYLTDLYGYEGHGSYYVLNSSNTKVRSSIIKSLQLMIQNLVDATPSLGTDASADRVIITSGYRDYNYQQVLFNTYMEQERSNHPNWTEEQCRAEVLTYSAFPGESEHQTGLCVDLISTKKVVLDESFAQNPAYAWLVENAHHFGFILRYPEGKEGITGYTYEPWHYRFVGEEAATAIYEQGITLEEYLQ